MWRANARRGESVCEINENEQETCGRTSTFPLLRSTVFFLVQFHFGSAVVVTFILFDKNLCVRESSSCCARHLRGMYNAYWWNSNKNQTNFIICVRRRRVLRFLRWLNAHYFFLLSAIRRLNAISIVTNWTDTKWSEFLINSVVSRR